MPGGKLDLDVQAALRLEFMEEADRLVQNAGGDDLGEGIMRLRALSDISASLSIDALLELAMAVVVESDLNIPGRSRPGSLS